MGGGGGGGQVQWNHCVHVCVLALSRRYLLNRSIYCVYIGVGGGGGGGVGGCNQTWYCGASM